MEARIAKLEEFAADTRDRLTRIETRLDGIEARMATKADLAELASTMVKWIVGAVSGLGIAGITVMTFVLNNATPKAVGALPAPVIINVPAPAASAPVLAAPDGALTKSDKK